MASSSEGSTPVSGPGRAADILMAFMPDPRPKRVTDLSRLTGLSPATALRIAKALVGTSMLVRDSDKSFKPGPGLIELARAVLSDADAANTAN
jgi:DNA-binding IclR family transcriptional regulator